VEGYKSGKQLTGHSLGYLACLVKILFQLDILSRIGPRRGLEGNGAYKLDLRRFVVH
jgi:hypothetical protein